MAQGGGGGGMCSNCRERIQPNLNVVACWWWCGTIAALLFLFSLSLWLQGIWRLDCGFLDWSLVGLNIWSSDG